MIKVDVVTSQIGLWIIALEAFEFGILAFSLLAVLVAEVMREGSAKVRLNKNGYNSLLLTEYTQSPVNTVRASWVTRQTCSMLLHCVVAG